MNLSQKSKRVWSFKEEQSGLGNDSTAHYTVLPLILAASRRSPGHCSQKVWQKYSDEKVKSLECFDFSSNL